MKKTFTLLLLVFLMTACNKQYDVALKSADKALILKTANDYFANKKWTQAIALYERLPNLVAGTDDAKTVIFNTAYANYYDKQYRIAAHHFKNYSVTFPEDEKAEEAAYMSALCYYNGSLDYNLDQANTESAINELQNFLNRYPDSERSKNINDLIDELTYKLEFKAYENARHYFKIAEYKAADVSFENVLADFPSTKLRSTIYEYILRSKYELAMNSVYDKKEERLENALAYTRFVEKELPDSSQQKVALDLREKLRAESVRFQKMKVLVEKEQARLQEKQREIELELDRREAEKEKKEDLKDQAKGLRGKDAKEKQTLENPTAEPEATFKIQRN